MLIDIHLEDRKVLVVGGGKIAERKTLQLLDSGSEVTLVGQGFTKKLIELDKSGQVNLEKKDVVDGILPLYRKLEPSIIIIASNNKLLNEKVAKEARTLGSLVCVVDNPSLSDFFIPAVAKVDNIRIAVSTKGKSPAMAGVIRSRVEKMITMKDIHSVELQSYARNIAKNHILSPNERRKILLQIIENNKINTFLINDQVSEAKDLVKKIILQVGKSN